MIKLCFFVRAEVESSPVHNQMCLFINIHVKNIIYLTEKCLGVFCPMKRFFVVFFFYSTPTFPRTFILKFIWADIRDHSGPVWLDDRSSSLWFSTTAAFRCCRKSFRFWVDGRWTGGVTSSGGWDTEPSVELKKLRHNIWYPSSCRRHLDLSREITDCRPRNKPRTQPVSLITNQDRQTCDNQSPDQSSMEKKIYIYWYHIKQLWGLFSPLSSFTKYFPGYNLIVLLTFF